MKGILGGAIAASVAIAGASVAHAGSVQLTVGDLDTSTPGLRETDAPRTTAPLVARMHDGRGASNGVLGMPTTFRGDTDELSHDLVVRSAGEQSSITLGSFVLNTDRRGDTFALTSGDAGASDTLAFLDLEGRENEGALQFIMWAGGTAVTNGSFVGGRKDGSPAMVPLPPALALGLVGLGTLIAGRKLKSKRARP